MSDSLRNQLLQAGFSETKKKSSAKSNARSQAATKERDKRKRATEKKTEQANKEAAAVAQRKATKAQIKILIDESRIKDFKGESVHRYILGARIRELHVSNEVRQKINDGSYVVTRLNGNTEIIPADTAIAIEAINPDWAIVRPKSDENEDDDYKEFKVPDDLQW